MFSVLLQMSFPLFVNFLVICSTEWILLSMTLSACISLFTFYISYVMPTSVVSRSAQRSDYSRVPGDVKTFAKGLLAVLDIIAY